MRESACDTLLKTLHTHTHTHCLIVVNLTTVLSPAVLVGNVSKAQRDSLLYLSLSFSEAGFLVITLPPSRTHTHLTPLPLSYMWFSLKSSEQQGPTSLSFVSFFAAFPCYSGSCGLPRGGMKDDTLNTPPSAPPKYSLLKHPQLLPNISIPLQMP